MKSKPERKSEKTILKLFLCISINAYEATVVTAFLIWMGLNVTMHVGTRVHQMAFIKDLDKKLSINNNKSIN